MAFPGPRTTAALSVVVSVATGMVTGLVTSQWSPALIATLAVLLPAGMLLAARAVGTTGGRTRVRQIVRGGSMSKSGTTAGHGADVTDTVGSGGRIDNSPSQVHGASLVREAKNGEIVDSPNDLSP